MNIIKIFIVHTLFTLNEFSASQEKTDSVEKATIDISDLKDLKAPTAEKPAVPDEEMKPSNTKR